MNKYILTFLLASASLTLAAQKTALTGTTTNLTTARNTVSTLKNGAEGLGFYPVTSTTTVRANTAYVAEPRQLLIDLKTLDVPVSGIREVKSEKLAGAVYDLSGRRVVPKRKSIYVQKGKKIVKE